MSVKIRNLSELIGQTVAKNLLTNLIMNEQKPQLMIFHGETGTGKTSLAEWYAMSCTCTEGHINPCLHCDACRDNLAGLNSTGVSRNIKKINMAKYNQKSDMKNLVQEIFSLAPISGGDTFYILEELQELGDNQGFLMQELDQLQPDVHIIITTTSLPSIRDTIRNRSDFKVQFQSLSTPECIALIDMLCQRLYITLSSDDRLFLVNATRHNPREISRVLDNLKNMSNIKDVIRGLYNPIDINIYLELFESLFKDFTSFILGLDILEQNVNIMTFWSGLCEFTRNMIFAYSTEKPLLFNRDEYTRVTNIMRQIPQESLAKLFKFTHHYCKTRDDVELQLMLMRETLQVQSSATQTYKPERVDTHVTIPELTETYTNDETPKRELRKLNLDMLNDHIGNRDAYTKTGGGN